MIEKIAHLGIAVRDIDKHLELYRDVMGMKGSLLITSIGHAYRVISLKRLIGYTLEEGIFAPVESQSALLDFI